MAAPKFLLVVLIAFQVPSLRAQKLQDENGNTVAPYYLDFNAIDKNVILDVRGEYLHIQYYDALGKAANLPFGIYNWKGEQMAQLSIHKEFGLNHFDVNLKQYGIKLPVNGIYTAQLVDEAGKKYEVSIRYLPPLKKEITVGIFVKPIQVQCDDPSGGNLVEFYGEVGGGKAPFQVNWYVMNKNRTDFMYQPKELTIDRPGLVSSIQVDKSPEYYVLLYVKDACGNEQTSTVQVVCEGNKKKFNTIFFNWLNQGATANSIR